MNSDRSGRKQRWGVIARVVSHSIQDSSRTKTKLHDGGRPIPPVQQRRRRRFHKESEATAKVHLSATDHKPITVQPRIHCPCQIDPVDRRRCASLPLGRRCASNLLAGIQHFANTRNNSLDLGRGGALALAFSCLRVDQLALEGDFKAASGSTVGRSLDFNVSREGVFERYGEVIGIALYQHKQIKIGAHMRTRHRWSRATRGDLPDILSLHSIQS